MGWICWLEDVRYLSHPLLHAGGGGAEAGEADEGAEEHDEHDDADEGDYRAGDGQAAGSLEEADNREDCTQQPQNDVDKGNPTEEKCQQGEHKACSAEAICFRAYDYRRLLVVALLKTGVIAVLIVGIVAVGGLAIPVLLLIVLIFHSFDSG